MLFDGVPFSQLHSDTSDIKNKALNAMADLFEEKLGVKMLYDSRQLPFERPDLIEPLRLAELLKEHGVITSFGPTPTPSDEPKLSVWAAKTPDRDALTGGAAWKSDSRALMATLGESIERAIWWGEYDHFVRPVRCSTAQIHRYGDAIAPKRFAGFSQEQRENNPRWKFDDSTPFLWVRGTSLVSGKRIYLPAQTVSGFDKLFENEPMIRQRITIGLATWPTKTPALLAGALEAIEREAYMIMWFNQLVLPRIALRELMETSPSLADYVETCERYRYKVHAIKLLTDAPAHAVCVVLEDLSGTAPRFSFGLKAHTSLAYAIEKAMTEALRARFSYRWRAERDLARWDPETPIQKIGHRDRLLYWGAPENAKRLEPLLRGPEEAVVPAPWDADTPEQHLERIVDWCKGSGFECAYVSLGASKRNPTSFSVEVVVIPELEPTHLSESHVHLGGERWRTVPEKFGLKARRQQYTEAPHPFS